MNELISIAAVVALGAISPGPNNLIVMDSALRLGIRSTLPTIAGVVAGSLLQSAIVIVGFEFVTFNANMSFALTLLGSAFLAWLGANLMVQSILGNEKNETAAKAASPAGLLHMVLFQFVNPKSWALVTFAVAALQGLEFRTLGLGVIFSVIPSVCLLFWALLGKSATALLAHATNRKCFDALMGLTLIALAYKLVP